MTGLLPIVAAKAIVEVALLLLLGRAVLHALLAGQGARREENYGNVEVAANFSANVEATDVWQSDVEDDQINRSGRQRCQRVLPQSSPEGFEALRAQGIFQGVEN